MGPLLIGSGNRVTLFSRLSNRCIGFNGAAADWQRKSPRTNIEGAAMRHASMGPLLIGSGNSEYRNSLLTQIEPASMGPLLIGSGNTAPAVSLGEAEEDGFNGAAADWQRKLITCANVPPEPTGFNGAAADWQRKYYERDEPYAGTVGLQWGRC